MRTLDRYIVREVIPPFAIALLVFTFVLIIPFIIELAEDMIAKGVPWPTLVQLMATLVPQALGLTIPMSLLLALLVAFGRLSGDREVVAMMACGVSTFRLLRPVAALALVAWAVTSWVLIKAIPDANQASREITLQLVADRAEGEVKPRVFFEDFPQTVLYVRDISPAGAGWIDVLAADTRTPSQPTIFLARRGRMLVNREARSIQMVLEEGTRHTTSPDDPTVYEVVRFDRMVVSLDPESVFPRTGPARGYREMSITDLREEVAFLQGQGQLHHQPVMEIHKKFSIPVACFVFALLGLALGATSRRDGKLASFVLGIAVIFVYYVLMWLAEAMAKGYVLPAGLAMWVPNLVLGPAGLFLLYWRARSADRPIRLSLPGWRRPRWLDTSWSAASGAEQDAGPSIGAQGAGARVVMVVRVPHFSLPRPGLLDLYVGRLYLRVLALSVVGMAGLFYISTFIDMSDKLFKGTVTTGMLLEYFWWATPQFLYYILAIAVLLSALVTIGLLTKNSELIVMRACGISLYRTAVPLLAFALLASGLLFAMEERVLAASNQRAHRLRHIIRGGNPQTFDVLNRKWLIGHDGAVYHYQFYDPGRVTLAGLSVFSFDPDSGRLASRAYAAQATFLPGSAEGEPWEARQGWERRFTETGDVSAFDAFDERRLPLEAPAYFVTEVPEPDRMNFAQLQRYISELRTSGYDVRQWEVDLQRKLAFPFVTLVMTLIAVPFAVTTGRRGAMYGVGIGIVLALVYWTLISIFAAFGAGGLLSPLLAAWAPNLLFAATAVVLLLTVRT